MRIKIYILLVFLAIANCYSQSGFSDRIRAYGLLQSGAYSEAVTAFSSLQNLNSHDKLSLGIALFYTGDYSAARKNFQIADEAGVAEANLWIAKIYGVSRNTNDALFYIERYLKTSKKPDVASVQKDSSFRYMHQSDSWFDLWQTDWYSPIQRLEQEAMFYIKRKNFQAAHMVIENALNENSVNTDLRLLNSKIYFAEENPNLALNELNQGLKVEPANISLLKERAGCFILLSDFNSALTDLNQLMSLDPTDFDIRIMRAKTAFEAKDFEQAEEDMGIYLQYFNNEDAVFLAGQIAYNAEDYYNALIYFNRLMKEAKPNALYFKARGLTYYQSNNYSLASNDLSMSLDLEPNSGETNLYMGMTEYYLGNLKAACYYWKKAKEDNELQAIEYLQKYCK